MENSQIVYSACSHSGAVRASSYTFTGITRGVENRPGWDTDTMFELRRLARACKLHARTGQARMTGRVQPNPAMVKGEDRPGPEFGQASGAGQAAPAVQIRAPCWFTPIPLPRHFG